ncbi:GIY-YIG nuclease family protein [Roseovarius sp.]|uniref:GIY-YIG nuclease family protein n=1 Tax=Roseovarius sp. TaxID=1486281 RepID=UPI003D0A4F80
MLTAEVFNWTGHVLRIPRTRIKEGLARPEAGHTGVYVLIGMRDGKPLAYIGEAESMRDRLRNHVAEKDWWEQAVLISTSSDALHKAHIKYLESRLVGIAKKVAATELENGNVPPQSSLSEAAMANMESFLDTLTMVLPAIRVDMFIDKARPKASSQDSEFAIEAPTFEISSDRTGVHARAQFTDGEVTVLSGSVIRDSWIGIGSWDKGYRDLREQLLSNGVVAVRDGRTVFDKDYAFSSPSAAAAVVLGRASNGRTEWKLVGSNKTYADWENSEVLEGEQNQ